MVRQWKTRRAFRGGGRTIAARGSVAPEVLLGSKSLAPGNLRSIKNAVKKGKNVPVQIDAIDKSARIASVRIIGKTPRSKRRSLLVPVSFIRDSKIAKPPVCSHCGMMPYAVPEKLYMHLHPIEERNESGEVDMGAYRIAPIGTNIFTTGLATCTGLFFEFGDKQFLTHIDSLMPSSTIEEMVANVVDIIKANHIKSLRKVTIYPGAGGSSNNVTHMFDPSAETTAIALDILHKIQTAAIKHVKGFRIGKIAIEKTCFAEFVPPMIAKPLAMNNVY